MNQRLFVVSVLASATMLLMSACSLNSVTPASAQTNPQSPTTGAGPVQTVVTQANNAAPARGITVVGMGQASGTPDVANVNIGIETQSASVTQAVADNRTKMAKLLETLKGLNIADKDINTTNYSVYTEQQPSPNSKTAGSATYRVNNQVNVIVRDISKLGDVLDKVVDAGANSIYGVNFSVADTSQLQGDARAKAMADAKARAESLAKLAGVSLGDVVSVSEVIGSNVMPMVRSDAVGLGGGSTPIQPGMLDVNMSVQVTYAIK